MNRKERQQRFHDSLVNMLYSSPSPPSHHKESEFDEQTLNFAREIVNTDSHRINTDELDVEDKNSLPASSEERGELGFQKLSRAQRKRLRKQKLKEAASHRRKIIGPQLPPHNEIDGEVSHVPEPEGVRRNAAERLDIRNDHNYSGETSSSMKVKHRRKSKIKARGKLDTPSTNFSHGDTNHDAVN